MVEKLNQEMINAMKNKDKEKLTVIRGIKGELKKQEIDNKKEINDELLIDVVSKQIKSLKDSITEFEKGNRADLVEKAQYEINVLSEYLPEPLTEEEVDKIIDEVIKELEASSMKDMGKVMKEINPKVNGRFDKGIISSKIRAKLQ